MQNDFSVTSGVMLPRGGIEHICRVDVTVAPALTHRNRLTCAFRPILAIPHLLLVGGPIAFAMWLGWGASDGARAAWSFGDGALGAVAVVAAIIAWFTIVFDQRHPAGLWKLAAFYLRWRVRAVAYFALLRDEYPPFGDGKYAAILMLDAPPLRRNQLTVAFRLVLVIPHVVALWLVGIGWAIATLLAWFSILFTGRFPPHLYHFSVGALRWMIRVEAYMLLLTDEYPPFSFE